MITIPIKERGEGLAGGKHLGTPSGMIFVQVACDPRRSDTEGFRVDGNATVFQAERYDQDTPKYEPCLEFKTSTESLSETLEIIREFLSRKLETRVNIMALLSADKEGLWKA